MNHKIIKTCLLAAGLMGAHFANATAITYSVSNATTQCNGVGHGLWTHSYTSSNCNEYYSFQSGSTLTVDGTSAILRATAKNEIGAIADIDIIFGGFADIFSTVKEGGGIDYNPNTDTAPDWDFFTYITSGTISFSENGNDGDAFIAYLVGQTVANIAANPVKPVLQIGVGANDKNDTFGASAWLDVYGIGDASDYTGKGGHWDLNMNLSPVDSVFETVPLPGTLGLLAPGIAYLGLTLRRRRTLKVKALSHS